MNPFIRDPNIDANTIAQQRNVIMTLRSNYEELLEDYTILQFMYDGNKPRVIPITKFREFFHIWDTTHPFPCSVCLETIKRGHRTIRPSCGHYYHPECLLMLTENSSVCSICRKQFIEGYTKNNLTDALYTIT